MENCGLDLIYSLRSFSLDCAGGDESVYSVDDDDGETGYADDTIEHDKETPNQTPEPGTPGHGDQPSGEGVRFLT